MNSQVDSARARHRAEVRQALAEEGRLLVWELLSVAAVIGFIVIRQLWLV
ncbi:MAG: hypothetical protein ACK5KO_13080 [Arachnia sp.]